jgi:tripartite-type tricarboxylate transporter receptor subunit TctC
MIAKLLFALAALAALGSSPARAEYPERPITIIVAFAAGGGVDMVARTIGTAMATNLGQPVIVENRPGAAGQMGTDFVARRAEPDGYTILMGSPGAITAGVALAPNLAYNPKRDLAAVGQAVIIPNILAANPSFPARNVKEMVELAKSGKLQINYGSGGIGTSQHLAGELLAHTLGISMLHVPYKGTAPSIVDAISGQTQLTIADPSVIPYIKAGKLRAIGVTTANRSQALPDLPTLAEQGATGYDAGNWYGFLAPKKTPPAVIKRLNQAINRAIAQPDVQKALLALGMDPTPNSPEEFQAFLDVDLARWTKLVNTVGLKTP